MRQRYLPSNREHDKLVKLTWSSVTRLLGFAKPYRFQLTFAMILMLLASGANLSLPLVMRHAIDDVGRTRSVGDLNRYALMVIGIILFSAMLGFLQYILIAITGNRIVRELRQQLFSHLERLPVAYFDKTRSGDLTSHLSNDVGMVQQTLTSDIASVFPNIVTLFGGIIVAFVIDWRLCLISVGLLLGVMLFFVVVGRRVRKLTGESLDALSDAMGGMTEVLGNIRLVKAFAREEHEDKRTDEKLGKVFSISVKTSYAEGAMMTVASTGFFARMIGVIWYGGANI